MKIDKWFHLYGRKDGIVFKEVPFEELPSAERVGHWYDKNEGIWNVGMVMACSNCGESFYEMPIICGEPTYNYCPNCGARMEGEEE